MTVVWSDNAVAQLGAIHAYISQSSERYATAMVDRLTARSRQLRHHPLSGGIVTEYSRQDVCEIIEGPYRIIYRVGSTRIDILTVLHGARQLPDDII